MKIDSPDRCKGRIHRMKNTPDRYIPALRFHWLTWVYDKTMVFIKAERVYRRLAMQTGLQAGHVALDLGCGTGAISLLLKEGQQEALITGLDADAAMLERAKTKAAKRSLEIAWYYGMAQEAPFESGTFDRVVSSLFFHHLTRADKLVVLRKVRELLKPGGEFHVVDWARPDGVLTRIAFGMIRVLDGFEVTRDHASGRFPGLIAEAGFERVEETWHENTLLGTLRAYKAVPS